jgi:6-phosphogluconolactonase
LTPIGATVVGINPSGSGNLDIAVSSDSKFLYSLNSENGTIGVFGIQEDGTLLNVGQAEAISAQVGFNGIAAF